MADVTTAAAGVGRISEVLDDALQIPLEPHHTYAPATPPIAVMAELLAEINRSDVIVLPYAASLAEPLVRYGVLPRALRLLKRLLQGCTHDTLTAAAATATVRVVAERTATISPALLNPASLCMNVLTRLLERAAEAAEQVTRAGTAPPLSSNGSSHSSGSSSSSSSSSSSGGSSNTDAARSIMSCLASEATLQPLADLVHWITRAVLPAYKSSGSSSASSDRATPPPSIPVEVVVSKAWTGSAALATCGAFYAPLLTASEALFSVAKILLAVLPSADTGALAAGVESLGAVLAALHSSDLLEALCTAMLETPACPDYAPGTDAVPLATLWWWHIGECMCTALETITTCVKSPDGAAAAAASALLARPQVVRLRWEAMAQVAASAPGFDADAATFETARAQEPRAPGLPHPNTGGGGGGSGAAARAARVCWPLLQRHLAPLLGRCKAHQGLIYSRLVFAAVGPADMVMSRGAAGGLRAAAVAVARRQLPPLERLAALSAACCRALCMEVEWLLGERSPGSLKLGRLEPEWVVFQTIVLTMNRLNTFLETCREAAPAPEVAASQAHMLVAVAWLVWALAAGARLSVELDEAAVSSALSRLRVEVGGWCRLSPSDKANCARRLLPTGLLASLDCLLRHAAFRDPDALDTHLLNAACDAIYYLLAPLLRARLVSAAAVGGKTTAEHPPQRQRQQQQRRRRSDLLSSEGSVTSWRPQDDLGLVLTAAKLCTLKLARLQAASGSPGTAHGGRGLSSPQGAWPSTDDVRLVTTLGAACYLPGCLPTALEDIVEGGKGGGDGGAGEAAAGGGRGDAAAAESCTAPLHYTVAIREAMCRAALAALPYLEQHVELWCVALSSRDGRGAAASWEDATTEVRMLSSTNAISCFLEAITFLPPGDLRALKPQRLLARLGRRLALETQLVQRSGAGASAGLGTKLTAYLRAHAHMVADGLIKMATREALIDSVVSWVGEGHRLPPVSSGSASTGSHQPQEEADHGLDLEALAAAISPWDQDSALLVTGFGVILEGLGTSGAAGDLHEYAATAALLRQIPGTGPRAAVISGLEGAPLWPARVLRLCGNPGCTNFGGAAEAALNMRKCGGCGVLWYCGVECQRQHWRDGGHRAQCAGLKGLLGGGGGCSAGGGAGTAAGGVRHTSTQK